MGQTPPNDLHLNPIIRVAEPSGWALMRRTLDGTREEFVAEFPSWPTAIVGWRIAAAYTRPVPAGLEAWTMVHIDGFCGGEEPCPHCRDIDARGTGASDQERNALTYRRNIPLGIGNYFIPDPDAQRRLARLELAEAERAREWLESRGRS